MTLRFNAAWRTALTFALALAATGLLAGTARADFLSVYADLPVAADMTFKQHGNTDSNESSSGLAGAAVGITLPIFVGFGYENYGAKFNSPNIFKQSIQYNVQMVDLFLNLPLPFINIAIGGGVGNGHAGDLPSGVDLKDGTLTQYFASLGIPFLEIFDVHVGYHNFSGSNKFSTPSGLSDLKVSGEMYSLGVKVGF